MAADGTWSVPSTATLGMLRREVAALPGCFCHRARAGKAVAERGEGGTGLGGTGDRENAGKMHPMAAAYSLHHQPPRPLFLLRLASAKELTQA